MYLVMTRWFGLRLDFLSTVILIAVTFMSIPLISLAGRLCVIGAI